MDNTVTVGTAIAGEWRQFEAGDSDRLEKEMSPRQKRQVQGEQAMPEEGDLVAECRDLLGEIIHARMMGTARAEKRSPLLDERVEYEGYHGCLSVCRVRVYNPTPHGQRAKRPLIVVFTELPDNPGTSVTNRVELLASLLYVRLGKPDAVPIFVEHYPDRGVHYEKADRWQFPESFSFVGFCRSGREHFQTPLWQHTTRMTIEVVLGQHIGE